MRRDAARRREDLPALYLVPVDAAEEKSNGVPWLGLVQHLVEHLDPSDHGAAGLLDAHDVHGVAYLDDTLLDTAGDHGASPPFCLITAGPLALAWAVAFTAAGDWLYGGLFGASPGAVREAKLATFVFSLSAPFLIARALTFGVLMIHRRTMLISWSTLARLASLGGSLVLLPRFVSGASAGAAALVTCMAVETLVSAGFAARYFRALPAASGPVPRIGELWRFAWPLMLNSSAEMGTVFVISIFLGRLADPDLALAAFGVVHGLTGLLMSPLRNLLHTAQTLARSAADRAAMIRFSVQVVAAFVLIAVGLFDTPLGHLVLGRLMGLSPELEAACAPAMRFAFVMAAAWGFSALLRGFFAGARRTTDLAFTGAGRLVVAAGVAAPAFAARDLDGALLGLAAWFAGYGAEAVWLALRLRARRTAAAAPERPARIEDTAGADAGAGEGADADEDADRDASAAPASGAGSGGAGSGSGSTRAGG